MAGSDGTYKLYQYDPSMAAAVIFILLFVVSSLLHTYQLIRTRTLYFIPFVIGIYCTFVTPSYGPLTAPVTLRKALSCS